MNSRRKLVIAFGAGALTAPLDAFAQPQGRLWRIGYLDFGLRQSMLDPGRYTALLQGLRDTRPTDQAMESIDAYEQPKDEQPSMACAPGKNKFANRNHRIAANPRVMNRRNSIRIQ